MRGKSRSLWLLAILVAALAVFTACGGDEEAAPAEDPAPADTAPAEEPSDEPSTEPAPADEPPPAGDLPTLKIGTALPFTGVVAESASEMREVMLMYLEEQGGTLGGLPAEIIFEDTETQPEVVVTKTKKLIEQDEVHLLASAMLAFEGLAAVDTVAAAEIPLVGLTGVTADEYRQINSPYISAAAKHTPSQETFPLGTYAYDTLGYRTAAIIGQDYTWGWQTTGGFHYAFEQAGGQVVQKIWAPIGTTDYAPFVNQINQDVDVVYVTLIGADVPRFVKAYSDFGLKEKIPLLGSEDLIAADAYRYYGPEGVGIIGITPFTPALDRPEMQTYVQAVRDRTGKDPTFWGEAAYVAMMVIDRTLQKLQENGVPIEELPDYVRNNAEEFIATVKEIDLSDTPSSAVTVDDYNFAIRDFYLVELVDEGGTIVEKILETFPQVSQFWTFDEQEILGLELFSRDFPPVSGG
jgi:branched-chain amino acid transport system substrate-binding protein